MAKNNTKTMTLMGTVGSLLQTGLFSDVAVLVGPIKYRFNLHQMILGGRSEVFATMMQQRWANQGNCTSRILELPEASVDSFKIFVKYIYTDTLNMDSTSDEEALKVMQLADLYQVPELVKLCSEQLSQRINAHNCLTFYKNSRLIDESLSKQSFRFFLKNIRKIAANGKYLQWDAATVRDVLMQEQLDISEIDLFKALLRWSQHKVENKGHSHEYQRPLAYRMLLKLIRFPAMGMKTFAEEVVPTNAFTSEETVQIFLHFANPQKTPCKYGVKRRQMKRLTSVAIPVYSRVKPECLMVGVMISSINGIQAKQPEVRIRPFKSVVLTGLKLYTPTMVARTANRRWFTETLGSTTANIPVVSYRVVVKLDNVIIHKTEMIINFRDSVSELRFDTPITLNSGKPYDLYADVRFESPNFQLPQGYIFLGDNNGDGEKVLQVGDSTIILKSYPTLYRTDWGPESGGLINAIIFGLEKENVQPCALM